MKDKTYQPLWCPLCAVCFIVATILGIIFFSSCATTTLYRNGEVIARFQSDGPLEYRDGTTSLVSTFDHSSPTRAGGTAVSKGIATGGVAVATSGILTVIH